MGGSQVLKAMLTSGVEEAISNCIDMNDFSIKAVVYFLEYLYTGTLSLNDDDDEEDWFVQLWVMADKYDVPSLGDYIEILQIDYITSDNLISIYLDADTSEAAPIRDFCLTLIGKMPEEYVGKIQELPQHSQARLL